MIIPVVIKRYQNRKLYNTETKKYVTLSEIENIVKEQHTIKVIDNSTGNDITAMILSQIIFEAEKNNTGFLPSKLLYSLIQSGGKRIDEIRQNIFNSLNLNHHYDVEIEKRINLLIEASEISEEHGNIILEKLLKINSKKYDNDGGENNTIKNFIWETNTPSNSDFQMLIQQIDNMSRRMDEYSIAHRHNV